MMPRQIQQASLLIWFSLMNNIVQFVPRADREAKENLEEFIRVAKDDLTAFEDGVAWTDNRWKQGKTVAVFATKSAPQTGYSFTPMAEPFLQFAKAYVRYHYSHKPVRSVSNLTAALQCVEAALIQVHGTADIGLLNLAVMDVSAVRCKAFFESPDIWYRTGRFLQALFKFCNDMRITPQLPAWKSPYRKPKILTEDLGVAGAKHRSDKLPSNELMLTLADLFANAESKESRFFSSIMVLLMVAPGRISEVLALPVDCIGWEDDDHGDRQMYLRWWAAKGKGATKKWIIPAMQSVVEEAVSRLVDIGAPARVAARYAYDNPGKFMRHGACTTNTTVADSDLLSPEEFATAVNIEFHKASDDSDGNPGWALNYRNKKWISKLLDSGNMTYEGLAKHTLNEYAGEAWPFVDSAKTVKVWDALCLHRHYEMHKELLARQFSWRLPTSNEVNQRIGSAKGLSLFDQNGTTNSDGSSIKLTSHQLRHWLSTMSKRAGMDDYTLAQWAGRASVNDNRHYDHRTPEEQLQVARSLALDEKPSVLVRFMTKLPVTYQELGIDRLGVAKTTLYGMCTHDYAMTPCQKQRECTTCKEHVCIKGDHITLDRVRLLENQTEVLLHKAQQAHEDGIFGADRWVDNHKWKLAHTKSLRLTLEKEDVPNGSLVRIPEGHDPSAVRRALIDLGVVSVDTIEPGVPISVTQALLEKNDA